MPENQKNINAVELSVVVPLFNEEAIIVELTGRLVESLKQVTENFEIIFVNDGSKDNTVNKVVLSCQKDNRIKFISFSRNFGHQVAVCAGLDYSVGKAVVIIDGDLQDPPELIPEMYNKYKLGYEVVYARRISRKGESYFKKITAKLFYRIFRKLVKIDFPIDTGDFRLIDRKIVTSLKLMPEKAKFLRGQIAWLGYRQTYVEFERDERKAGKTGYTLRKMVSLAVDGITAFSDFPLRFVTTIGIIFSVAAFLIIIYAVVSHFVMQKTITGWTSIIISSAFLGGIQLISIGIIGTYISRINNDVRNRPLYIIDETNINNENIEN